MLASLALALGLIGATQAFAAKDPAGGGDSTNTADTTETTEATSPETTTEATTAATTSTSFKMVPSVAASGCLPDAKGKVTIKSKGPVEVMNVSVSGLPKKTEFDLFVIQQPNNPFGVSWYQGDIDTDKTGEGSGKFIGRFSIETFAVAPGSTSAPVVHTDPPFPDAPANPPFNPIHTFHLGLWFNSPKDAEDAGCPNTETPFNGDHTAGIQVLKTEPDANGRGPLARIQP
jgi:hypothetical protein